MQSIQTAEVKPSHGELWTFAEAPVPALLTADPRQLRLECAKLALQVHDSGFADDGATVMETARLLAEFVESGE